MLTHLSIRNFTLIDRLELPLGPGLVILSGETGAGKSIVFDALGLLAGSRASADVVRTGADEAFVQASFAPGRAGDTIARALEEAGLPETGDTLLVRRVITRKGPNRIYINDTPATLQLLQRLVTPLVEVLGQHQHLSLQRPEVHRELLDTYGGLHDQRAAVAAAVRRWREATAALEALAEAAAGREQRIAFLRFRIEELEGLHLRPGEYEELEAALGRARNVERLRQAARDAAGRLYEGADSATDAIGQADAALSRAAALDPDAAGFHARLDEVRVLLDDLAHDVRAWARALSDDIDIDALESRHEALRRAMRRFGRDEDGLVAELAEMRAECARLEHYADSLEAATAAEDDAFASAHALARALDEARAAAAERLFRDVGHHLAELAMPRTRLSLEMRAPTDPEGVRRKLASHGLADAEILFSPNPGEPPRPLGRVASGGELSRLMLAFKTVLFQRDPVDTYLLDEIDSGIGGGVAEVVGRLLKDLARERQVICITHLAQIASFADAHFRVTKEVDDDRTVSRLVPLDAQARAEEIARLLGGTRITDATRAHARDMLRLAQGP